MMLMPQVVDDLEKEKGTKTIWSREGELQAAQESKCNKVGIIPSKKRTYFIVKISFSYCA
jgi:hypothetical protein